MHICLWYFIPFWCTQNTSWDRIVSCMLSRKSRKISNKIKKKLHVQKKTPCRETFEIFPYMEFKFKRLVQTREKTLLLIFSVWTYMHLCRYVCSRLVSRLCCRQCCIWRHPLPLPEVGYSPTPPPTALAVVCDVCVFEIFYRIFVKFSSRLPLV